MTGAAAIPVLPVAEIWRATAWYERLGFTVVDAWDDYAILRLDGAEVHLSQLPDEGLGAPSWAGAYLRVADADVAFERWTALGAPVVGPLADRPHGMREFATEDPDGNLWRIGTPIAVDDAAADPLVADGVVEEPLVPFADVAPEEAEAAAPAPDLAPVSTTPDGPSPTDGSPGTDDDHWFAIVAEADRCAGCGLAPKELPARALGAEVRDVAHDLGERLRAAPDAAVRHLPADGSWSALEYGVHVRDLLGVFADRIVRVLTQDKPELAWWDHHEVMSDGMANESDVHAVADDLGRNASLFSQAMRMATDDDWDRMGTIGGTHPVTVELLARITLHETVHHRSDVARLLGE